MKYLTQVKDGGRGRGSLKNGVCFDMSDNLRGLGYTGIWNPNDLTMRAGNSHQIIDALKEAMVKMEDGINIISPENQQYLKESAAYINARRSLVYDLVVQIGMKLLEVKQRHFDLHRYPSFQDWCATEFAESYDTLLNYMNIAKRMGRLDNDQHDLITMTALYKLARKTTPEEAREIARSLASDGHSVDYDAAWILANAPPYLRLKFAHSDVTRDGAIATTKALKEAPPQTKQFCERFGVADGRIVEELDERTMQKIIADDGQLNGIEWSKPVGQATSSDYERWKADRQRIAIDERTAHITTLKLEGRIEVGMLGTVVHLYPCDADEMLKQLSGAEVQVIVKVEAEHEL